MKSLIVCGENYANSNSTWTVTNGATKAKLYDQIRSTQCISGGSAEGDPFVVQVDFKNRLGAAVGRTINRIILLNHNLKNFYFEYWDGSAWQTIAESVKTTNTESDNYIEMAASVTTLKLRLTATNTIDASAEKKIGELKACLFKVLVRHLSTIQERGWDDGGSYRLQGGSLVTFNNVVKFEGDVTIEQVTLASYEILKPLVEARSWMVWLLAEDFRLASVHEVAATSTLTALLDRKTYMYSLAFKVGER